MNKKAVKKNLLPYVFLLLVMIGIYYMVIVSNKTVNDITYDEFLVELNKNTVTEISITPKDRASVYEITGKLSTYKENETFFLRVPLTDSVIKNIITTDSSTLGFKVETNNDPESSSILLIIVNVLPFVLLIGGLFFIFSKQMSGAGKSMDFGKSRAKLNNENNKTTFKDVAGLKEEKEEVQE